MVVVLRNARRRPASVGKGGIAPSAAGVEAAHEEEEREEGEEDRGEEGRRVETGKCSAGFFESSGGGLFGCLVGQAAVEEFGGGVDVGLEGRRQLTVEVLQVRNSQGETLTQE